MVCERNVIALLLLGLLAFTAGCEALQEKEDGGAGGTVDASAPPSDAAAAPDAAQVDAGALIPAMDASLSLDATVDAGSELDASDADASDADASDADASDADASDDDGGTDPLPELIEIAGRWHSNFGGTEAIDSDKWGNRTILEFDNAANYAITQNPADAVWGPSKFNKIVWTEIENGSFYYCWVDFSRDTADEARNTTNTADASDPENGGCGGFSWTKLSPVIEIEGTWLSNYGGTEVIDSDKWGNRTILEFDNAANYAITQNPADAMWGPSKFNKIVWTEINGSSFYYCWVDFSRDTADEARNTTNTADASDPESGGCGGFPWTRLDAQ